MFSVAGNKKAPQGVMQEIWNQLVAERGFELGVRAVKSYFVDESVGLYNDAEMERPCREFCKGDFRVDCAAAIDHHSKDGSTSSEISDRDGRCQIRDFVEVDLHVFENDVMQAAKCDFLCDSPFGCGSFHESPWVHPILPTRTVR